MKCIPTVLISVITGMAIGSVLALLFAPTSGADLRARVSREVTNERQRVKAGYEEVRHQAEERLEKMHHRSQTGNKPSGSHDEEVVA